MSKSTTTAPTAPSAPRPAAAELDEIARRVNIAGVVLALEADIKDRLARENRSLMRAGSRTRPTITCPFHAPDHHPSLELDLRRNRWICRSCPNKLREGMQSTIDLVMGVKDWNFTRARDWLIDLSRSGDVDLVDLSGLDAAASVSDEVRLSAINDVLGHLIDHPIGNTRTVDEWAQQQRGLPSDFDLGKDVIPFDGEVAYRSLRRTFSDSVLGAAGFVRADGWPLFARRQALIVFRDPEGRPVWAQGIFTSPPPTPRRGHKPSKYLGLADTPASWPFGANVAAGGGYALVVCEGAIDALTVQAHLGIAAIGLPGTEPWFPKHWPDLFRRWQRLVLAHDPEPSGDSGARYFVTKLESYGLRWHYSRWAATGPNSDINDSLRDGYERALPAP